jgi:hypothetical protein
MYHIQPLTQQQVQELLDCGTTIRTKTIAFVLELKQVRSRVITFRSFVWTLLGAAVTALLVHRYLTATALTFIALIVATTVLESAKERRHALNNDLARLYREQLPWIQLRRRNDW